MWAYAMGKLWASFFAAASVVAMYAVLLTLFGKRRLVLLLTLAYALGTTVWSQSSQHLLQHGFSCFMMLGALAFLLRCGGRKKFLLLSGLCVALAVMERYNNIFFAVAAAGYVAALYYRRPAALLSFMAAPVTLGALLLSYNFHYFNTFTGGYYRLGGVSRHILTGLAGILISPSRGLFVYSPFLLVAVAGIVVFIVKKEYRRTPLLAGMIAVIVINIVIVSRWPSWWGGWCYGPRLLTEIVPLMILFIPFLIDAFPRSRTLRGTLVATVVLSGAVQAIGVFCYPAGMSNGLPVNIDNAPERLWSVRGSQILVEARAGLNTEMLDNCIAKITGRAKTSQAHAPLPDSAMRVDLRPRSVPAAMIAGYSYRIPFSAINRSGVPWPALADNDGRYGITMTTYWKEGGGEAVPAAARTMIWDTPPGATWSNYIVVIAPLKPGIYRLGFDLFQSGRGWFHDHGSPSREYSVTVGP